MTFDPRANFYKLNYPAMMNNHCSQPKIFLDPLSSNSTKTPSSP